MSISTQSGLAGETGNRMLVSERARRRIARRILPYLFVLYVIAYLDRVNLSYAALEMTGALHFTPEVYGLGAGIFFIGYFLLEIPGTILVEKWSARRWMARIMISWGLVAAATGFIHTTTQFYWIRFLLGVAEAGFFPGMIVYLSHWVLYADRARAMAIFMAAQPVSNIVGSPISGFLLGIHWLGLPGWRWLFILEGIPAVLLGVATLFYLTDWPHQARWLLEDERQWIASELQQEHLARQAAHSPTAWQALRDRNVLLLCGTHFCIASSVYGFNFWLPTLLKKLSGFPNLWVALISALPFCVGLAAMVLIGWSSDRNQERRRHTAFCLILVSVGLALSITQTGVMLSLLMFCIAAAGMYGYLPSFWSIPSSFLSGTAAAACVGLINSVGNLGGFAGPFMMGYLTRQTNSSVAGMLYLSLCGLIGAVLVLSVRPRKR